MSTETSPEPVPGSEREMLLARWREARRRREAAELDSPAFREAAEEIARLEIEIARTDRAMNPPLV
jgi:hypothetical protein